MHLQSKKAFFGDLVFEVFENVYEPAEDSFLFAENLTVAAGERVLDMGTGCGILGVVAAKTAREVVSVDLNPYAILCARKNSTRNTVSAKMMFLRADLFTSLKATAKFDAILFNAPYLPTEEPHSVPWLDRAWAGGSTGRQVIERFILQAPTHLERSGRILLMQSTLSDVQESVKQFATRDLETRVVAERALPFFEKLVLLEARCHS